VNPSGVESALLQRIAADLAKKTIGQSTRKYAKFYVRSQAI
jgi:hypothetical protein